MKIDSVAQARIIELEADLEAEGKRVDLLQETIDERDAEIRSLKGQLARLLTDRRYVVG